MCGRGAVARCRACREGRERACRAKYQEREVGCRGPREEGERERKRGRGVGRQFEAKAHGHPMIQRALAALPAHQIIYPKPGSSTTHWSCRYLPTDRDMCPETFVQYIHASPT